MKKRSFWDILAWICLFGIAIWLILKMFGIINTPIWIEYAPFGGALYILGWQVHKLEVVSNDVKDLKRFKEATIDKIHNIEQNCMVNHKK